MPNLASRPARVLHVVLDLHAGGLERLVVDLVERADRSQFDPEVLVLRFPGRLAEGLEHISRVHVAPRMSRASLLYPGALASSIRSIAPDVVHTHSGVWLKATRAARMAAVRHIVHTDHGREWPDPWQDRLVDYFASRNTNVIVAVSERLAGHLKAKVVADSSRVRCLLNGVDTALYAPAADDGALRRELGIGPARPIIGSIGRLEPIKGYDIVLDAFIHARDHWPREEIPALIVAGEGSELEPLRERAKEAGLEHDAHFIGWRNDSPALYRAFTVFTMGSRSEGTSVSLLEAMSAGVCPVVTNVGGNSVVLGAELQHRMVPPLDPPALAEGWREALRDAGGRSRDAERARGRVVSTFSLDAMVRGYEEIYRELLSRESAATRRAI